MFNRASSSQWFRVAIWQPQIIKRLLETNFWWAEKKMAKDTLCNILQQLLFIACIEIFWPCIYPLRCMAAPLSFEFERVVNSSHQTGNGELSAGKLELTEYLFERSSSSTSISMPYSSTQVNTVNFLFIKPFNSHEWPRENFSILFQYNFN